MKKFIILTFIPLILCGCGEQDPNAIKYQNHVADYRVHYNEVVLNWGNNTFTHNDYTIYIPEKWGAGILGKRDRFRDEINCHDIEFAYEVLENVLYSGETTKFANFKELKEISSESKEEIFYINTNLIDIDSKLLIKDEYIDDYYFKVDFFENFNNFCYFKISKHDISQIKSGSYNQINVKLKYLLHIDGTKTFKIDAEKDGLNDIGYYSDVSIAYNPENSVDN